VVDRVVAVVRRHVLGADEASAWTGPGRVTVAAARLSGVTLLYSLRFVLAPRETGSGVRRVILAAAPLPAPAAPLELTSGGGGDVGQDDETEPAEVASASKRVRLAWWYGRDPGYGKRESAAAAAKRIAARIDLSEGTARAYIAQILADLEKAGNGS
jgi:hypothetical protein